MGKVHYKVFQSNHTDPRVNLAYEECLLNSVQENECIVFFWQSENAIVIGRNQNPFQECSISNIERDNVILVRRLSGGGAVYHDMGNLNFAFIAQTDVFDIESNFDIVLTALKTLNIDGEFNGRNDLLTDGRKFSGNAFIHEENRHLHHGTLLIDTDMERISNYLTVSHKKLETKGFDSVKSRVINLKTLNQKLSVGAVVASIIETLSSKDDIKVSLRSMHSVENQCIETHLDKYMNHQWNYGESPAFGTKFEEKFSWGLLSTSIQINDGKIESILLYTDALDAEAFEALNRGLVNTELTMENVINYIKASSFPTDIRDDLVHHFVTHIFN